MALTAIGLDDVKRLKNATGTTVNDVVLAVCTGALRAVPDRGRRAARQAAGGGGAGVGPARHRRRRRAPTRCRRCSCSCRSNLDDPLDRLQAIHDGTKGAKEEHNALGADMLLNWAEHATPNVFANAARLYSPDAAGRPAPAHRQPGHLQRARSRLPALPGRRRARGRLPARPGHGRDGASTSPS